MNEKTCCFTGHRPQRLPWRFDETDPRCGSLKLRLRAEIEAMITKNGVTHFISGMALGVDTWAAEIVLDMKKSHRVTLECALPCETQAVRWRESDRNRYFDIVSRCDTETMLQTSYTADCFQKRNTYMVDRSDFVIAVYSGAPGGTDETIRYARKKGRSVCIVQPAEGCLYLLV